MTHIGTVCSKYGRHLSQKEYRQHHTWVHLLPILYPHLFLWGATLRCPLPLPPSPFSPSWVSHHPQITSPPQTCNNPKPATTQSPGGKVFGGEHARSAAAWHYISHKLHRVLIHFVPRFLGGKASLCYIFMFDLACIWPHDMNLQVGRSTRKLCKCCCKPSLHPPWWWMRSQWPPTRSISWSRLYTEVLPASTCNFAKEGTLWWPFSASAENQSLFNDL